ncbi:MAG: type II secretion system F family protein, partial [Bradymonadaceae bacterium]
SAVLYISLALGLVFVTLVLVVLGAGDWAVERLSQQKSLYEAVVGEELHRLFLDTSPSQFIMIHLLAVLASLGFGYIVLGGILGALVGGVIGVFAPRYYLKQQWQSRIKAIDEQVEEAVIYMANSFKANPSLPDAIKDVTKSMGPPISEELEVLLREYQLGTPIDQALINLQKRMPSRNLELAISALRVGRSVGGDISDILEDIADTIRESYRLEREIDKQTAQGRMQAWVMGLLPLAFLAFMYWFDPQLVTPLFESFVGYMVIAIAAVLNIIGVYLILKVVDIEV